MNFNLFKNRNFLLYSLGQGISNLGSTMTFYALSLYVLEHTKSSSMFAFILSAKYIPQIFLYPFSGVIVDKIERKKLLIFFDGFRGLFLLLLLFMIYVNGEISLLMIYSIVFTYAIADTFYNPATNSIIPFLFDEKDYIATNSFTSWVQNLSLLVGPILGTAIYSNSGILFVLICDAISFLLVMTFTIFLRFNKISNHIKKSIYLLQDFKQGVNLVFKNKDLLFATLGICSSRFFINPIYTIGLPLIIINLFKAPVYALSITQSFIIVGTLVSPVIVILLTRRFTDAISLKVSRMGKIIPFTILLAAGFNDFSKYLNIHIILLVIYFSVICFLATMFNSSGFVFLNSYFQRRVPNEYLGRFASVRFMFYSVAELLGINFFGLLYGKVEIFYPLLMVLVGAIIEAILLSYVSKQEVINMST
ncbi:MFS transporter [Clostridium zeae]|uniref:MFS transporter n=1 Tax=Clostridium zeae TaxID=2759022 RepID=A0ABQ1E7M9_9CLOT|nr:MFS transporter [Clostridium zeae]GFZ30773.1 MFS transporter [Clostridium zeae]